ncbi:Hypp5939 [Branchiostoma lanceolatum]|uniref:Hypp5939 protein n=1 Tax=Branchiostoma lanceolatum TaxID=7740 RepID=A0A8J9YPK2_BRALA|nr:Hypp5939 [Branchiostoma lanceolatum]
MQVLVYARSVFVVISWTSLGQLFGATAAPTRSPWDAYGVQPFEGSTPPSDAVMQGEGDIASSWQSAITDAATNELASTTIATIHGNLEADISDTVAMEGTAQTEPTELPYDGNTEDGTSEDDILPTDAWTKAKVERKEETTGAFGSSIKAISDAEGSGFSLNNGTCIAENGGLACICTAFYRGRFCEKSKLKLTVNEELGTSATVHWSMVGVNDKAFHE